MPVHAFIFPGQGSQAVGMGRDLAAAFPAAREVFEEVDETLKQKLSKLMFEGPGEELMLTENTQPALMAHSLAVLRVLEKEGGFTLREKAVVVAGHSLGEYTALAAAGSFSVADAARLLKLRGQAMQKAVPAGEGAMAALLGADMAQAEAICAEAAPVPETEPGQREVIEPANDNGGGQIVVSGHRGAVERAVEIAASQGRAPRDAAAGLRAVPLRADGTRRRRDGRGAGDDPAASRRWCRWSPMSPPPRRPIPRRSAICWSARSPPRCAGANASTRWWSWAWTASSNSAPARCCPG